MAQQASSNHHSPRAIILDSDSKWIGIDNRASAFLSGDITDFDGPLTNTGIVVRGYGGTRVTGVKKGTAVLWIEDDDGRTHRIRLPNSYYVPGTKDRLLSPQHFAQEMSKQRKGQASETTDSTKCVLYWAKYRRTVPLDPTTNVATMRSAPGYSKFTAYCAEAGFSHENEADNPIAYNATLIEDDQEEGLDQYLDWGLNQGLGANTTLVPPEGGKEWIEQQLPNTIATPKRTHIIEGEEFEIKERKGTAELLSYHLKYNHAPFSKMRIMAQQGTIPRRLLHCQVPVCAACMYGKATKRPWRTKTIKNKDEAYQPTAPGEVIAVDQMRSPTPGLVAQLTGKLTNAHYEYVTVFVDAYSGRGYVYLQKSTNATETLEAKLAFERWCQAEGVTPRHYHADNGIFRSKAWMEDCLKRGQGFSYAGVDAHHQNGRAEARIRRLSELARTMLSHAQRKWPQEISTNLWPYAIRMANDSMNATPSLKDPKHRSPDQIFSGSDVATNPKHWIHFGSPVFVLEASLRGTTRIFHKWKQRSNIGIYLGRSPIHSRSVALVLNPETGLVSPQFHVKHDGNFDTIPQLYTDATHESKWQLKAGFVKHKNDSSGNNVDKIDNQKIDVPVFRAPEPTRDEDGHARQLQEQAQQERANEHHVDVRDTVSPKHGQQPDLEGAPSGDSQTTKRTNRARKPIQRLIEVMTAEFDRQPELFSYQALYPRDDDFENESRLLMDAMKATTDPDTLYLHEARKEPDWNNFADAMQQEIDQQVNLGVYSLVKRSLVPKGATTLPAVWQLKRKRNQRTGEIKKHKARCNIDGSRMKFGEHYEQTYAPVAGWTAIRLVLAMVLMFKWHTVQLDYVLAFPQAPAVRDIYMEIPKGFTLDGVEDPSEYVLQVNRNIYGGKDAGRTWYIHLKEKLEKLGFVKSSYDDCLFFKGNMVYVLYTDDSILAGPDKKEIMRTIDLIKTELDITYDEELTDFLGVNIDRRKDGTIKLSQPHLVEQIIKDLNLNQESSKTKETPAASSYLISRDEDGREFDNHFNYRSIIGKMHYLVAGSRNEIAYAVHQCARFSHEPKMSHAAAVKWIGRYLKGTAHEGTIMKPDRSKGLEVFVDADFAGNWDSKLAGTDRSTARSRHGYYIMYGGIPIAWKSTLQTEIALSSTESEVTGLSYALREAIPIMNVLNEMAELGYQINSETPRVHCKVFEDNSGAIEIARTEKYRPRTKHLNNRLFHFRTYMDRGEISIQHIGTEDQIADILTKPLNETLFVKHRLEVNGW